MAWSMDYRKFGADIVKHVFEWTSDGSGNATLASGVLGSNGLISQGAAVSGAIARVVFIPSATAAPTNLYDVTLTDADGVDVLSGQGANLSDTAAYSVCPGIPLKDGTTTSTILVIVNSVLTLNVSNAGASKSGKVVVYVR